MVGNEQRGSGEMVWLLETHYSAEEKVKKINDWIFTSRKMYHDSVFPLYSPLFHEYIDWNTLTWLHFDNF